jgi:CBS domain containing-hemolysin-like protein
VLFVILAAVIFLILVNSVFVATEISLVASRITRLEELAEGGSKTARRSLEARKDQRKQLSGSQLGITLSSVVLGILAEPSIGKLIKSLLENLGAPSRRELFFGSCRYKDFLFKSQNLWFGF